MPRARSRCKAIRRSRLHVWRPVLGRVSRQQSRHRLRPPERPDLLEIANGPYTAFRFPRAGRSLSPRLSLRSGPTYSFRIASAAFPNSQFYMDFSEEEQGEAGPCSPLSNPRRGVRRTNPKPSLLFVEYLFQARNHSTNRAVPKHGGWRIL